MLQTIAIVIAVLLAALLGFAATKPDTFRIQRSALIQAPPAKIFPLINDFRAWSWSPYEKKDPAMKRTFSGPAAGKGAAYAWHGNRNIGKGRMEILEAAAPSQVTIQLDFLEPFEAHNVAEFTLEPNGSGTNVTWAMHGPNTFLSKLMSVFFSMEKMVGPGFEAGLAALKAIAER